jgi:hypothetical protein
MADSLASAIRDQGITAAYSWVVEGNTASESFVEGRGSVPIRRCATAFLPGLAGGNVHGFEQIMERSDEVASLVEATYRSYQFTPEWDVGTLCGTLDRLGPLGWQGMYGKRVRAGWDICFGLWDYQRVMRMAVRDGGSETHVRPFFLFPLAWRGPEQLREGILAAQAMIAAQGGTLLLPHVPGDPVSAVIPGGAFRIGMTLYGRGIELQGARVDGPVFIDPADL